MAEVLIVTARREPSEPATLTRDTTGAAAPVTGVHFNELGALNVLCWLVTAPLPTVPFENRVLPIVETGCTRGVERGETALLRKPTR